MTGLSALGFPSFAADKWGGELGYPIGWGPAGQPPRWEAYTEYRVGNYSGGFEQMFRYRTIERGKQISPLLNNPKDLRYRWGLSQRSPDDYLAQWPVTSLIIARDGQVYYESYRMGRASTQRMTSWSMAKSVTSLIFGIALDRGLIRSLDDAPQEYVPQLQDTLHGRIPLRHLLNMSSGADVLHERDPIRIDVPSILGGASARTVGTDLERVVREWSGVLEVPGVRFNYNELCPLTIGMVIRAVSGLSLSEFTQNHLWQPLGAEGAATWLTDSKGKEYNCVGFAARTRDWARLGQLVAQNGRMDEHQVVSEKWVNDCASWGVKDRQVTWGAARPETAYKNFFWHPRKDGSWMVMVGHHGQRVIVDRLSRTVCIQTAVSHEGAWPKELYTLFEAATQI